MLIKKYKRTCCLSLCKLQKTLRGICNFLIVYGVDYVTLLVPPSLQILNFRAPRRYHKRIDTMQIRAITVLKKGCLSSIINMEFGDATLPAHVVRYVQKV